MKRGSMTVRQAAWFLDRPYYTVYTWVYRNREPYPFYRDDVMIRLNVLERVVRKLKQGEPLAPPGMSASEREIYVRKVYADARVSRRAATE